MNTAPARLRVWLSALATAALVLTGSVLVAAPAAAAAGDVSGATLQWGVKASFRSYLASPIAAGGWTVDGAVTDTTPFTWSGGTGTADQAGATGSVAYGGSIHFRGHEGFGGIGAGNYALDLNLSDVRIVRTGAATATIMADVVSNSLSAPSEFVTSQDVEFATVDLAGATDASTADTVAYSGAPAVLTAAGATAFAGFYGAGTALDAVSFSWPVEQGVTTPTTPTVPTVTVSKVSGLSPAGETITVTGTGFAPVAPATTATRQPLAGSFGGVYVAFGRYADTWRPSEDASPTSRVNGSTKWVVEADKVSTVDRTGSGAAVAIGSDGSFTVQLSTDTAFAQQLTSGNYGVYTYAGGGVTYAPFETYTPVTLSTDPLVVVSQTTDLAPAGQAITVKGYNFGPRGTATNATRPPLSGTFGGVYVAFGRYADTWRPSERAPSSSRSNASVTWVVAADKVSTVDPGGSGAAVAINPDGSFTVVLQASAGYVGEPATGNYGVYTYPGGGYTYAAYETATPVSFGNGAATTTALVASPATGLTAGDTITLTATVEPDVDGTVTFRAGDTVLGSAAVADGVAAITTTVDAGTRLYSAAFTPANPARYAASTGTVEVTAAAKVQAAGSLTWGVKQSFRSYVTGPIAQGSITATGVAASNGLFTFGQSAASGYDPTTGIGSTQYGGSVRFVGHAGVLDVTLSNPRVQVTGPTSATLLLSVNGAAAVPFATLDLSAGTRTTPQNAVRYAGVPAALTAQGASAFALNGSGFYAAGEALDPVTFVIGSTAGSAGGTTTSAYAGARTPALTPPASTGAELVEGDLVTGGEVTFAATGFQPNEPGILAVIYSTPTLLGTVTADGSGTARWTGALPDELTGEHTFTFQGSVDRGLVVQIEPAAMTTSAAAGCPVADATLTWGFKESFRSYVSGSIANGEWTAADGATYETPLFTWSDGSGAYDAAGAGELGFAGSIRFTGHGGVLDTTVANPVIRFTGPDTAVLLLDVTGTTQDGQPVASEGVEFVELDLGAATVENTGGSVTITDAPAVLTDAGAAAFGTYPAGEAFDPVTVAFSTGDCALQEPAPADGGAAEQAEDAGFPWLWVMLAAIVLIVIAVVVTVLVRRRRA